MFTWIIMVSKFSSSPAKAKLVVTILPTRWIPLSNKYLQHHFDACGFFLKQGMVRWLVRWVVDQNAAHNWQNERFARRQYIQHILYRRQYIQYILKRRQYIQHILYSVCIVHCLLYKIHSIRPTSPTHLLLVYRHIHKQLCSKKESVLGRLSMIPFYCRIISGHYDCWSYTQFFLALY